MSDLFASIILAAGSGTRMVSDVPKVLHTIAGKTMLEYVISNVSVLNSHISMAVVRHARELVAAEAVRVNKDIVLVDQDEIPGTGRAVLLALQNLPKECAGSVLVTCSDIPMLSSELLQNLFDDHSCNKNSVTILSAILENPSGYGRIVRNANGEVSAIVEHGEADLDQLKICEINSGIYIFEIPELREAISEISADNSKGEIYLTDVIQILVSKKSKVATYICDDVLQLSGVNDRKQLAEVSKEMNRRILDKFMYSGVTIVDPETTWIDASVKIENDVTILPGTQIYGDSFVAKGAVLGPGTTLNNVHVAAKARILRSYSENSRIGSEALVGPYSFLRSGSSIGSDTKVGAFVETKNLNLGSGSKISHLSYFGDADVGENSNIGAGTICANYNGVSKNRVSIGSNVKVGANNTLVAPVSIADRSYTAAGTTVRKNVPEGALALNVTTQRNVLDWVAKNRENNG